MLTTTLTCLKCGQSWTAKVPNPVRCPRCSSVSWRKPRKVS